jgi:shikimate kinase
LIRSRIDPGCRRAEVRHFALKRSVANLCSAILRMNQAPAVEVHIVQSQESPGGMGEAGTSAMVPAVANAIFAATGKRLRKMPIDATVLKRSV